jgi:hypothetical protein
MKGQTVACLASGPSLTFEDCEAVRHLPCIAVNATFRAAPWAQALYGMDAKFWAAYADEISATFKGTRYGWSRLTEKYDCTVMDGRPGFTGFINSGCDAISLAVWLGASRIVLLGYDCALTNGKTHWHGDHPKGLSNARTMDQWPAKFKRVSEYTRKRGVPVLNASRATALRCFPRVSLAEALETVEV